MDRLPRGLRVDDSDILLFNYGGVSTDNHAVENNDIQWTGGSPILADGSHNNIINHRVIGPNDTVIVGGAVMIIGPDSVGSGHIVIERPSFP